MLGRLRQRLDEPISWGLKRRIIEVLVDGVRVDTVERHGVRQADITVTYRFNQPDEVMTLVLPQAYSSGRVLRIPMEPKTIGDHIRLRRLELKRLQKEVAARLGVTTSCVFNWEANTSQPEIRYMPAVIQFLGYNPLPDGTTLAERLVRHRTALGLPQSEASRLVGVDQGTLA